MSAMTLISFQKSYFITSNKSNLILKLKKGVPVGCQVSLRGEAIHIFLERFLFQILPQFKGSLKPIFRFGKENIFFTLDNLFFFKEIEKEYENFQDLPKLNITMVLNSRKKEQAIGLLSALKFPIKK
jgi:large subunit ribosomal protein L5